MQKHPDIRKRAKLPDGSDPPSSMDFGQALVNGWRWSFGKWPLANTQALAEDWSPCGRWPEIYLKVAEEPNL